LKVEVEKGFMRTAIVHELVGPKLKINVVNYLKTRFQINSDYPLNLSILISGGKENNYDCLSNGE